MANKLSNKDVADILKYISAKADPKSKNLSYFGEYHDESIDFSIRFTMPEPPEPKPSRSKKKPKKAEESIPQVQEDTEKDQEPSE